MGLTYCINKRNFRFMFYRLLFANILFVYVIIKIRIHYLF